MKSTQWKRAIVKDAKRGRGQKKEAQKKYYQETYNRRKSVEFKTKKETNMNKYFLMSKLRSDWRFTQPALAIYPVLCGRADFYDDTKWVRISRENIGKLAGISSKSVDEGIKRLTEMTFTVNGMKTKLLQVREWQDGPRRGYEYLPGFHRYGVEGADPKQWKAHYFSFHTCIIDSGVWAKLSMRAKALYLAMRSVCWFDQKLYHRLENIMIYDLNEFYPKHEGGFDDYGIPGVDIDIDEVKNDFVARKWEICESPLRALFEIAGMACNYRTTKKTVSELDEAGLVVRLHDTQPVYQVWLRST